MAKQRNRPRQADDALLEESANFDRVDPIGRVV